MATKVEVGFELTVGDTPYFRLNDPVKGKLNNASYRLAGPIWIDISDKVASVNVKRGKNRELDRYSAGQASVVLHNEDRTFDPLNTASPYVGNIVPRRSVRVSTAGVTQFTGVVEDWNLDYDVSGKSNAVIQAADAFTLLAQQSLTAGTATSQLTGARVNAVLSQPSVAWPLAQRQIDVGNSLLGADVYSGNVLSYLQQVEASEQGQLFMSKGGDVRFVNGSTSRTSGTWTLTGTNLVTNPSMESVSTGAVVMRRNLVTNPSFEVDTTGWSANFGTGGAGTAARVAGGFAGGYEYRMTWTTASTGGFSNATGANIAATVGATYTYSAWVKTSVARQVQATVNWLTSASAYISTSYGSLVSVPANTWTRVSVTATAPANTGFVQPNTVSATNYAVGDTFSLDAAMVEASSVVGDYFDGSTTDALGWDYAWSGTANASISTAACAATTVRTNRVTNPSVEVDNTGWIVRTTCAIASTSTAGEVILGTKSVLMTVGATTGSSVVTGTGVTKLTVTAGTAYTYSLMVKSLTTARNARLTIDWYNGGTFLGQSDGTITLCPLNSVARLSVTGTALASATLANLFVQTYDTVIGEKFSLDGALFEASSTVGDFFDGSFTPAGDFSYGWTGTANASTSVQYAPAVDAFTKRGTGSLYSAQSISRTGGKSSAIRCLANDEPGIEFNATGLTVGETYTFSAWVYSPTVGGGGTIQTAIENVAYGGSTTTRDAWTRITQTWTATVTSKKFTVQARGTVSGTVFFVDAVQLEASPIVGAYFDGSTTPADNFVRYAWTGTANASTSTKEELITENILQFADDGTGIPYTNASVSYGTELLYNQVSVTYPGGTVTANNTDSQTQYGISTTEVDTLLSNSTQAQTLADFWVSKYGNPEYRFQELTVNLTSLTGEQQSQILASELGDIISIKFTPNRVGSPIELNGQIVAISHSIGIDRHDVIYGFAAVPFTFLVLDDEGYGILDNGALGF